MTPETHTTDLKPLNAIEGGLEPGIHEDVPDAVYFALPYLSQSQINSAFDDYGRFVSLAHGRAATEAMNDPERDVTAFRFGTAFHKAVLEPEDYAENTVAIDKAPGKTKAGKKLVTGADFEWAEGENPGKTIIRPEWAETIEAMCEAVMAHKYASKIVHAMRSTARRELVLVWDEPVAGELVRCRAKIDRHLPGMGLVDLKSSADLVCARSWGRTVLKRGYHRQKPWYLRGSFATGLDDTEEFFFVPVEKSKPHGVSVCTIGTDRDNPSGVSSTDAGWNDCREYLYRYAEALQTGRWYGYDEAVETVDIPGYAMWSHSSPAVAISQTEGRQP